MPLSPRRATRVGLVGGSGGMPSRLWLPCQEGWKTLTRLSWKSSAQSRRGVLTWEVESGCVVQGAKASERTGGPVGLHTPG